MDAVIQATLAFGGALALFAIRHTLVPAYLRGSLSVAVPAVAFGLVWGAIPLAGALVGARPVDVLMVIGSLSMFAWIAVLTAAGLRFVRQRTGDKGP